MADEPRIVISSEATISSEEIARRTFATAFRGFDAPEVRSFLKRVADAYAGLQEDVANLRRRVDELQRREREPIDLDEDTLTAALGAETARVLKSAREAATDIQAKAEGKVARMVQEAEAEAARLREEAEQVLGRRVDEAEEVAGGIRRAAEADAEAARSKAKAGAQAEIDAAKAQGRELLTEAQALREKVLSDLARRRKVALAQVEQLRAGRERLLEAYRVVRRTLDEVTVELSAAEAEARLAAESAGRKVTAEPDVTIEELEAELAAGRSMQEPTEPAGPAAEEPSESEAESEPEGEPAGEAEPEAETSEEPVDAAAPSEEAEAASPVVQLEERRSSTLRLLRRSKPDAPVAEPDTDEEVRVIRPESDAEPESEPASPPTASGPQPQPPAPADDVIAAVPGLVADVVAPSRKGVDALFARIRADRAASVAEAHAVLDERDEPAADETVMPVSNGDESALQRRDELLKSIDGAVVRKLKRALQNDQNETLDRVRTSRGPAQAADVLADEAEHAARFRDVALEALADAARAGVTFAAGDDAADTADVGDQADELALELVVPLRERLGRNLEDGATAGDDVNGVIDRVGTTYREWKVQRIEPLARYAVATVFARNAYAATPDGATLRWVVDDDGDACPDCDDDALAGPTPKGEAFPTGQLHPPAHPGCRCLLVRD